jgi:hypothetical protein
MCCNLIKQKIINKLAGKRLILSDKLTGDKGVFGQG